MNSNGKPLGEGDWKAAAFGVIKMYERAARKSWDFEVMIEGPAQLFAEDPQLDETALGVGLDVVLGKGAEVREYSLVLPEKLEVCRLHYFAFKIMHAPC